MLLEEHARYHKLGPRDCKWEGTQVAEMAIARQTSALGEQSEIKIPIFKEDSREEMMDKIQMAYSIMQERMEEQNKVVLEMEQKSKARANEQALKKQAKDRNKNRYERELKELRRKANKDRWSHDSLEQAEQELAARFNEAQRLVDENPIEAPVVALASGEASLEETKEG